MDGIAAKLSGCVQSISELRQSKTGVTYVYLKITVSQPPDSKGNVYDMWVNVVCFGALAAKTSEKIAAGQHVYCEGIATMEKYTRADGSRNSGLHLKAHSIEPIEEEEAYGKTLRAPLQP